MPHFTIKLVYIQTINLIIVLYVQAEGFEPTKQLSPSILSTGCIPISSCSLFYLSVY